MEPGGSGSERNQLHSASRGRRPRGGTRARLGRLLRLALLGVALVPDATWAQVGLSTELVASFDAPVFVTAPDRDPRLFVVERAGRIWILEGGNVLPTPFLDISDRVSTQGHLGLFGLAFAPDYAESDFFYVYYLNAAKESTISRFRVSDTDPNVADPAEEVVFTLLQPGTVHVGGTIAFSPLDGFLYLALGDGGRGPYDPLERAQDPQLLFGKMIRIDVSGGAGTTYSIPADNPFVGQAPLDEIWSLGLRSPFRFSFDRESGDLWIGDVGENDVEEIDFEPAGLGGRNYGWDIMEGSLCNPNDPSPLIPCLDASLTLPFHEYAHGSGGCSVTGGYVSRGATPEISGLYLFGDFCSGRVWILDPADAAITEVTAEVQPPEGAPENDLVSFGEGGFAELYVVYLSGRVFRIRSTAPDTDDDFAPDSVDNCPSQPNPGQEDADGDGTGDGCDDPCDDGLDNDGDGLIDYPSDPGCADGGDLSEHSLLACDDGNDNDGDGWIDYPNDPGCFHAIDNIENPECQDGMNNDPAQDAWIDFDGGVSAGVAPESQTDPDPQCTHAWQIREARARLCGLGYELAFLLVPLMWWHRRRRRWVVCGRSEDERLVL